MKTGSLFLLFYAVICQKYTTISIYHINSVTMTRKSRGKSQLRKEVIYEYISETGIVEIRCEAF